LISGRAEELEDILSTEVKFNFNEGAHLRNATASAPTSELPQDEIV